MTTIATIAPPQTLDIVYPVRPGDVNPELKFSLRTIEANYPHGRVWIVGHKPPWLTNVNHIPGDLHQRRNNIWHNILAACLHPDTPQRFAVFNDDFFITAPMTELPVGYRGTLADHIKTYAARNSHPGVTGTWWPKSLETTRQHLITAGYPDPISYELHIPFVVDKHLMAETLQRFAHVTPDNPPQWRSLYGNINHIGGVQLPDCKHTKALPGGGLQTPFHSTDDGPFGRYYALQFKALYPKPSRYEKV